MARGVVDGDADPGQVDLVAVPIQFDHLLGLAEDRGEQQLTQLRPEVLDRIGQHEPVLGMDVGGAAVGVGHLLRRPDVVDVAVGEQHSRRRQPILVQDAAQLAHRALAWVDDDGVGSGVRRQHVAVALQQPGGKSGDQHELQFPIRTIVDGSRHPY